MHETRNQTTNKQTNPQASTRVDSSLSAALSHLSPKPTKPPRSLQLAPSVAAGHSLDPGCLHFLSVDIEVARLLEVRKTDDEDK